MTETHTEEPTMTNTFNINYRTVNDARYIHFDLSNIVDAELTALCAQWGIDENDDSYWDDLCPQAMAFATETVRLALHLTPDQVDIEGLNGDLLVDTTNTPEPYRTRAVNANGARVNVLVTVGTLADLPLEHTTPAGSPVATDRREDEPCEAGTVGCSVAHGTTEGPCETW